MNAVLILATFAALASADPLFDSMAGHWTGHGERRLVVSGRVVTIEADVVAELRGENLVSRNTVTEHDGAAARTYVKTYWIKAMGEASNYQLGAVNDDDTPAPAASSGVFENGTFSVLQSFGGKPELHLQSATVFDSESSTYRERLFRGDEMLSETEIEYRRNP